MSNRIFPVFFLIAAGVVLQAAPPDGSGYSWKLIFDDEFEGTSLDRTKWISQHPWTRDYKGDAYNRDENVTVGDGCLTITAKAESYAGHSFTSGAISTGYSKFRFKYGYAEARIKMPGARGSWANFWMLTDGWPPEFDVVEYPLYNVEGDNNQRYRYITNIHYGDSQSNMATHWRSSNLSAGFHTYALDWRPWYVAYYFDDGYVRSLNDFAPSNDFGSMYLILDYYVGGDWSGEVWQHPDPATWPAPTSSSVQMKIDWVRVWQRIQDTVKEMIGRWTLDEISGTTAFDSSGKGMHGQLKGGLSFDSGRVNGNLGTALMFDGVDDYIELPAGFDEFDNGFTVALWARPTAVKNYARFIDLGNGAAANNIILARSGTSNHLLFKVYGKDTSDGTVTASNAIELNRWQFFAATINTSGSVKIYKNGQVIQTGTSTWPWGVQRTKNYIGRSNWSSDAYYQGAMDEIRIYDYALSEAEIQALFEQTAHCMYPYPESLDLNWDCVVDLEDIVGMMDYWLAEGLYPAAGQ
ncbi:MAG TPA: family 16 glycosylhydrolase [Anaerohalosphaeraceae bacterium]|nr:family 16 glycosylhydrolase [Anaerohalosphaeraceae bacterium]HPB93391.1 family 16 glycosylhydrolase [Anaerohalosphaeraceae bacterium]HRT23748.1 family 16 glycosylhydrolase [Anaerohalosphaeraceae bacterium]